MSFINKKSLAILLASVMACAAYATPPGNQGGGNGGCGVGQQTNGCGGTTNNNPSANSNCTAMVQLNQAGRRPHSQTTAFSTRVITLVSQKKVRPHMTGSLPRKGI